MAKPENISQALYDEMMAYGQGGINEIPEDALTIRKAAEIWNMGEGGARRRLNKMVADGKMEVRRGVNIAGTFASINLYTLVEK